MSPARRQIACVPSLETAWVKPHLLSKQMSTQPVGGHHNHSVVFISHATPRVMCCGSPRGTHGGAEVDPPALCPLPPASPGCRRATRGHTCIKRGKSVRWRGRATERRQEEEHLQPSAAIAWLRIPDSFIRERNEGVQWCVPRLFDRGHSLLIGIRGGIDQHDRNRRDREREQLSAQVRSAADQLHTHTHTHTHTRTIRSLLTF